MKMIHSDLTLERWVKFSLFEQLANIGTDVERTIFWRNKNNQDFKEKAFERVLELLYLTLADPKNRGAAGKELSRVKEVLIDYFVYDNEYGSTDKLWQMYFFAFNYAAALEKNK